MLLAGGAGLVLLGPMSQMVAGEKSYRFIMSRLSVFKAVCVTAVIKMCTTGHNLEHIVCVML